MQAVALGQKQPLISLAAERLVLGEADTRQSPSTVAAFGGESSHWAAKLLRGRF